MQKACQVYIMTPTRCCAAIDVSPRQEAALLAFRQVSVVTVRAIQRAIESLRHGIRVALYLTAIATVVLPTHAFGETYTTRTTKPVATPLKPILPPPPTTIRSSTTPRIAPAVVQPKPSTFVSTARSSSVQAISKPVIAPQTSRTQVRTNTPHKITAAPPKPSSANRQAIEVKPPATVSTTRTGPQIRAIPAAASDTAITSREGPAVVGKPIMRSGSAATPIATSPVPEAGSMKSATPSGSGIAD